MGLLLLKLNTGRKVGPQLYIKLITTEGENRVHETLHTYSESAPLGAAPKTAAGGWWTPPGRCLRSSQLPHSEITWRCTMARMSTRCGGGGQLRHRGRGTKSSLRNR